MTLPSNKVPLHLKDKSSDRLLIEIGQRLAELRKKKGYTSYETFAYDHDLPRAHYWRIEKGKVNISIKSLNKILTIHKITMDEFFSSDRRRKKE